MKNTSKHVYVEYYGELWRLSDREYRKLLHLAASYKDWDMRQFKGKRIAETFQDVSYISSERAAEKYHARYGVFPTFESCRDSQQNTL